MRWVRPVIKLEVDVVRFVVGAEFYRVIAPIQGFLPIGKNSPCLVYLSSSGHHQIKAPWLPNLPFQIKSLQLHHHDSFGLLLKKLSIFDIQMENVFALVVRNPFLFLFFFDKIFRFYLFKVFHLKLLFDQRAMRGFFDPFALKELSVALPFFLLFFRELKWLKL